MREAVLLSVLVAGAFGCGQGASSASGLDGTWTFQFPRRTSQQGVSMERHAVLVETNGALVSMTLAPCTLHGVLLRPAFAVFESATETSNRCPVTESSILFGPKESGFDRQFILIAASFERRGSDAELSLDGVAWPSERVTFAGLTAQAPAP